MKTTKSSTAVLTKQTNKLENYFNPAEKDSDDKSQKYQDMYMIAEHSEAADIKTKTSQSNIVTEIPPVMIQPEVRRVSTKEFNKVVIDLETSSRGDDAEICQIAATDGRDEFNVYVIPENGISPGASAVNKLRTKRGMLFHNKRRVTAVRLNRAVTHLLNWLKFKTPCLLIAHNAKCFDAKHLVKAVAASNEIKEFGEKVLGFSDTLTAFRELFPYRKSYSQTNLAKDLLNATYNAHNALDDVQMLHKLVLKFISDDLLMKHSFTLSWVQQNTAYLREKTENLKSLKPLIKSGKITQRTAENVAASGLNLTHMQLAFQNGRAERLCAILEETVHGKPRVTKNKKILTLICSYFEDQY